MEISPHFSKHAQRMVSQKFSLKSATKWLWLLCIQQGDLLDLTVVLNRSCIGGMGVLIPPSGHSPWGLQHGDEDHLHHHHMWLGQTLQGGPSNRNPHPTALACSRTPGNIQGGGWNLERWWKLFHFSFGTTPWNCALIAFRLFDLFDALEDAHMSNLWEKHSRWAGKWTGLILD
jgi:hypothetical protein